ALLTSLLPSAPAHACGGLFCNQPQNPFDPPPVAQTPENVLFAMEPASAGSAQAALKLEAHVQIFYTGPADRFSWVVPVDSKPELDVGTDQVVQPLGGVRPPQYSGAP